MTDRKKENQPKPLIYMVEPEITEQVFSHRQREEPQEQREQDVQKSITNKEEKFEQIKREFGVYEVMAEIEKEKNIVNEWTQAFRKPEQVEQPIVHEKEEPPKEQVVVKKKKKKKRESVTEIITRIANSKEEPRPICEANLFGKVTQFQVLGIRREAVKIRIGHRVRIIKLSDINQLKVISG